MFLSIQLRRTSPLHRAALIFSLWGFLNIALALLPPTSPPIFKNTPFAVIWNAPTDVCKRLEISLDTSAFQAVTTPASDPDQFLFLFYSNRLGLYPYINDETKEEFNGGIPQKGNITASLLKEVHDVTYYIPELSPGLAVIDWESWRPLWARNWGSKEIYRKLSIQFVQENWPSFNSSQDEALAKEQFQNAARAYMEQTVKLTIKMRPKYLWGYYLFPDCYNYGWDQPGYTGECPEKEIILNGELHWLWNASTALFPSAYLPLDLRNNQSATYFVRGRVQEAIRVSTLPKHPYTAPIYVYLRPLFRDQSVIYLSEADLISTIGESAALGASGAILWGASADYSTKDSCEALAAYLPSILNPYITNVTAAAKLCSSMLCQGKGRCLRKNPQSNTYLHLNPKHFHIQGSRGKYLAIGTPSLSDISNFVENFSCQCYAGQTCSAKMPDSLPKIPIVIRVT
ncbi:hyaluronidase PH-20-like [Xyrauchen texanus]|uniref:hyaluronidase PH-20-like n=1 Tax=Xyrauchen texanus TaxID=154827 RepID=UPI002241DBB1|nr:hyaluronidase PH-20-like [Xyrauchen texanus]